MDRRNFLITAGFLLAVASADDGIAQEGAWLTNVESAFRDDQQFQRMLFGLSALAMLLTIIRGKAGGAVVNEYYRAANEVGDRIKSIEANRSQIADAVHDAAPQKLSPVADQAVSNIGKELASNGIETGSPLYVAMVNSLEYFLAGQTAIGQSVDDWICGTFPFSYACR